MCTELCMIYMLMSYRSTDCQRDLSMCKRNEDLKKTKDLKGKNVRVYSLSTELSWPRVQHKQN